MKPGLYVARVPARSRSNRVIIESVCFQEDPNGEHDRAAARWQSFIQSEHPKDQVFIMEVFA